MQDDDGLMMNKNDVDLASAEICKRDGHLRKVHINETLPARASVSVITEASQTLLRANAQTAAEE